MQPVRKWGVKAFSVFGCFVNKPFPKVLPHNFHLIILPGQLECGHGHWAGWKWKSRTYRSRVFRLMSHMSRSGLDFRSAAMFSSWFRHKFPLFVWMNQFGVTLGGFGCL